MPYHTNTSLIYTCEGVISISQGRKVGIVLTQEREQVVWLQQSQNTTTTRYNIVLSHQETGQ